MGVPYTPEQLKKLGLVEKDGSGVYVPIKSLVAEKVIKIKLPPDYMSIKNVGILKSDGTSEPVIKPNAKIKNATKVTNEQGIKFDSYVERYMYDLLTGAGIHFEFQKTYWLMQNFKYRGETVRGIKIIMDFWLPTRNIFIDTKGWQTYDGKLKHKMLKSYLTHIEDNQPEILMPATKKDCDLLLNQLLYKP